MKLFPFFKTKKNQLAYKCSCCGKVYDEIPLSFGSDFPAYYHTIPAEERENRIELEKSLCVIDKAHFFHRGRITIPILNYPENLVFDVWTTISEENFTIRIDSWNDKERINNEPYFGWLQNQIITYGNTLNIKTIVSEASIGNIPAIKVIEENHQLTKDQENGISYGKAMEIVNEIMKIQHQQN